MRVRHTASSQSPLGPTAQTDSDVHLVELFPVSYGGIVAKSTTKEKSRTGREIFLLDTHYLLCFEEGHDCFIAEHGLDIDLYARWVGILVVTHEVRDIMDDL